MSSEMLLPIILVVPALLQVLYYLFFTRFSFARAQSKKDASTPPISVIVCGRNEEENFKAFLPKVLKQKYHEFEVVAVNDQSIDNSKDALEELQKFYDHLHIVNVDENERFWNGKKYGLTLGIKAAKYEHMLFIDADCVPNSENWIAEMAAGFRSDKKQIVLGFGAYQRKRGLLNMLIRFETLHTAIQYFSWALLKLPYMGVGRNLAYTKSLFFAQRGFVPHMHIPMGDDDLFINAAGNTKNATAVFTKDSFTVSKPKAFYKDWFVQKRRHIATSGHYKGKHKFLLGLYGFSQVLFFASLGAILLLQPLPIWVWYFVGGRYFIQYLIFVFAAKKTGDWDLLLILPLLELFLVLNQVFIMIVNRFNSEYKWK